MAIDRYETSEDYMFELKYNENFFDITETKKIIKPLWNIKGHENCIDVLHVLNDDHFITGSHDCKVIFWNIKNKKEIFNLDLNYPILSSSYKNNIVAFGLTNNNNNICLINTNEKKKINEINTNCGSIFCLNYFDNDFITCGSKNGNIILIDVNNKKKILNHEIDDCINSCVYNSNYNIHMFSTYKGNLFLFDFRLSYPFFNNDLLHSKYSINCMHSINNHLYTGGSDCLIKNFDIRMINKNNQPLEIFTGHTSSINFLSFSKNNSCFCSCSSNGCIKLWKNNDNINISTNENKCSIKKNILNVNDIKGTVKKNIRSRSILSECSHTKLSNLKISNMNEHIKRNLTPSVLKENQSKKINMNKSMNLSKIEENKKKLLYNMKNNITQNIVKIDKRDQSKKKNITNFIKPKNQYLNISTNKLNESKVKNKLKSINQNNLKDLKELKDSLNIQNIKMEFFTTNRSDHIKKPKINYCILSMLKHKCKVSAIDWIQNDIISASWDQTIKRWQLKDFI